jgi:hypothetical protein
MNIYWMFQETMLMETMSGFLIQLNFFNGYINDKG